MVQYTRCFGTIKWRVRGFFEGKIQSPPSTDYSTLQTCIALETKFTSIAPGSYIYDTSNSFNYLHQFEKSTNKVLKRENTLGSSVQSLYTICLRLKQVKVNATNK